MARVKMDRERAEEWLDHLAKCADRMSGKITRDGGAFPTDEIWRDETGNVLVRKPDGSVRYVMVQYERPMMEAVADVICRNGGDVLNVGFGCGLVDDAIQNRGVERHVIVEAHPRIMEWMRQEGWPTRRGVEIIHSQWEDVCWTDYQQRFDGVFFDTFPFATGRKWDQLLWHECVHRILKPVTGVGVIYGIDWTHEAVEELVHGFWRDDVTIGWTECTVEVPFEVDEWKKLGVGTHTISFPYFSLAPKSSHGSCKRIR